jgi:hypothetical protein
MMSVTLTLEDAVAQLDTFDRIAAFFVRRPWLRDAECVVAALDEHLAVPLHIKEAGLEYFLEVSLIHEILEVFENKPASLDEKIRLLIDYAENDVYPDWVYQR